LHILRILIISHILIILNTLCHFEHFAHSVHFDHFAHSDYFEKNCSILIILHILRIVMIFVHS